MDSYAPVTIVDEVHHQFDGRPIRDFIPVLVEGEVVDHFTVRQAGPSPQS